MRTRPSIAIHALAVGVLFVLPLSLGMLLFSRIRDPELFQFAFMSATSLTSMLGLALAVSQWNRNRAIAHSYLMMPGRTSAKPMR